MSSRACVAYISATLFHLVKSPYQEHDYSGEKYPVSVERLPKVGEVQFAGVELAKELRYAPLVAVYSRLPHTSERRESLSRPAGR